MRPDQTMQIPTIHGNGRPRTREPLPPLANIALVLALLATPLGVIRWVWTADWRWLVTGLMVTLILLVIAAAISGLRSRKDRTR